MPPLAIASVTSVLAGVLVTLWADAREASNLRMAAKAVASAGFVATALAVGAAGALWSAVAVFAMVLAASGDVALTLPGRRAFLAGLGLFAAAHVAFVAAFGIRGLVRPLLVATALTAAPAGALLWNWLRRHVPRSMRPAVGFYIAVVMTMAATGVAVGLSHGSVLLIAGVLLMVGSDVAVARQRFIKAAYQNRLFGLPAYYLGQVLIALSLAG